MAELDTVDLFGATDFLPHMPPVRNRVALLHRLQRRLSTRRGRIPWWPEFGTDLREFLLSKGSAKRIAAAAVNECKKDEQVEDASAINVSTNSDGRTVYLMVAITDSEGPLTFTLEITDAAVTLIPLQGVT